jgi:hypothetical protein
MSRTTIDIDDPILREVKRIQKREGKTLGETISSLLADALSRRAAVARPRFAWLSKQMDARIDIDDKDQIWATLDGEPSPETEP